MIVRLAELTDLPVINEIYAKARQFMAEKGNPNQWHSGYPLPEVLEEDVALRRLYVCEEDSHIFAVFMMAYGADHTYAVIEGEWKNDLPYATLHRIASTGEKSGMMDFIVEWAFGEIANLRGDTHELNLPMQKAFERNGFERCGTIWVDDGTPRIAYQKVK